MQEHSGQPPTPEVSRGYFCEIQLLTLLSADSRAGTLIHEASHFTTYGGTDDYAYGQTAAKALVRSIHFFQNHEANGYLLGQVQLC